MTLTGLVSKEYIVIIITHVCVSGVVEVVGKKTELHDYMLSIIHGMKYLVSL